MEAGVTDHGWRVEEIVSLLGERMLTGILIIASAGLCAWLASRFMWWATKRSAIWAMFAGTLLVIAVLAGHLSWAGCGRLQLTAGEPKSRLTHDVVWIRTPDPRRSPSLVDVKFFVRNRWIKSGELRVKAMAAGGAAAIASASGIMHGALQRPEQERGSGRHS